MKAIVKRELKGYLKNPIFWVGLVVVIAGVYQCLSPYLKIHYFKSDQEIQNISVEVISDADIMDGYVPSTQEQQIAIGGEQIRQTMIKEMNMPEDEANEIIKNMQGMSIREASIYLERFGYYNAEYTFEDLKYHQGGMQEVNGYIEKKLQQHSFSYYFARKFADFAGLFMAFSSTILLAFLFLQDTRKNTYELLHTKPVRSWQYILGKIGGGFLVLLLTLGILNAIFIVLCAVHAKDAGFTMNSLDFVRSTCIYILPNMLMIVCVYTIVALIFKNPLPAAPLLFLYMIYSNMGSIGPDGVYGYYGRPLAIMVRFPGRFFDTTPPPLIFMNQVFLVITSLLFVVLAILIWKRRRVY